MDARSMITPKFWPGKGENKLDSLHLMREPQMIAVRMSANTEGHSFKTLRFFQVIRPFYIYAVADP